MKRTLTSAGRRPLARAAAVAGLLATTPVLAHHPMGGMTPQTLSQGLLSGLGHPIIGLDHLAFLVVAALLAYLVSGPGRWLAPLAFVGGTIGGTLVHVQAIDLPAAELIIAASVLLGGAIVLAARHLGAGALGLFLAVAGLFHGYAYGEAIIGAEQSVLQGYLAGFAVIQYMIIAGLTFALTRLAARRGDASARLAVRSGGLGAVAVGGLFLVAGMV